jgi:hypothetical protein
MRRLVRMRLRATWTNSSNVAEAFHQEHSRLAAVLFDYDGETDGFKRFEIAPHRAGVFRIISGTLSTSS